jgi:hypothetical protein
MISECTHLDSIKLTRPTKHVCEDCVKIGDTWVHLRMCPTCGHVGCCDSSKKSTCEKAFHKTNDPRVRSIEPGERWAWCYVDDLEAGILPPP